MSFPESSAPISRLLNLPAELRLRIYQEVLTAPDAAIRMYFSFQHNHRVQPRLGLGLLRCCRQIHAECEGLVCKENAVFAYADCFQPSAPAIGSSQLPYPALHAFRCLFLVLDVSEAYDSSLEALPSPDSLSNFAPIARLTSIRRLRVAVVARRRFCQGLQWWKALLGRVIERIPSDCKVEWGSETETEGKYVEAFMRAPVGGAAALMGVSLEEVGREVLMRAAAYAEVRQGELCGKECDGEQGLERDGYGLVRTW